MCSVAILQREILSPAPISLYILNGKEKGQVSCLFFLM